MRGRLKDIQIPFRGDTPVISFEVQAAPEDIEKFKGKELEISIKQYRKKRSLDANAFLWKCLGEIAAVLRYDPWEVYLYMLERYGKFTYIEAPSAAVADIQGMWREVKIVGEEDGRTQLLCFFGSSTYNTQEFSRLLDGVLDEMKQLEIPIPPPEYLEAMAQEIKKRDQAGRQTKERQGGEK